MAIHTPNVKTYGVRTLAYLDTFAGLVPCVIVAIDGESIGRRAVGEKSITIRLTATRGAYKRGEILRESAVDVPPRNCVIRRRYGSTINSSYRYSAE
jgi:hypothetical protein